MNQDKRKWHKWFAWHPVCVRGRVVWLKTIERSWLAPSFFEGRWEGYWLYRPVSVIPAGIRVVKIGIDMAVKNNPDMWAVVARGRDGSMKIVASGVSEFNKKIVEEAEKRANDEVRKLKVKSEAKPQKKANIKKGKKK